MKINYRPEIDGLRALAVGFVILYHAQISFRGFEVFKGGFFGVDIFFVISGYLITSILLKEISFKKNISILYFYQRRIRRILPVLLFVICISLPAAWHLLLPISLVDFSKSVISSLFFGSNFYFHITGLEYAAQDSLLKPLLHTWSLSVEEQFYILFPIIFFLLFRYLENKLIPFFLVIAIVSLILAQSGSTNNPSSTFYFLHTRTWELLAGSLLACKNFNFSELKKNENFDYKKLFPSIGIVLILFPMFFFNDQIKHPSLITVLPVLGVSLIIIFANKEEIITNILSSKLFVGIGLISYSLYLWHYPVFAFARISGFIEGSYFNKFILGVITLSLSIFSYYLIERPARNKNNSFKIIFSAILIVFFSLIFFNYKIIENNGFKKRAPDLINNNIDTELPMNVLKDGNGIVCMNKIGGCEFNINSNKKVFLIGDSHMGSIAFDLKERLIDKGYSIKSYLYGNCLYFHGFDKYFNNKISDKCLDSHFKNLEQEILNYKDSIIIFLGRVPLYLSKKYFDNKEGGRENGASVWSHELRSLGEYKDLETSFKSSILKLTKKGNKVILVYPIPEVGWDVPNEVLKRFFIMKKEFTQKNYVTTSFETFKNRTNSSFKLLNSIKDKSVFRVYPHELFCDNFIKKRCVTHNDKEIFYSDDDHPSLLGSIMINNLIIKKIETKIE